MYDIDRFKHDNIALKFKNEDEYITFCVICSNNNIPVTMPYYSHWKYLYGWSGHNYIDTCAKNNFLLKHGWDIIPFSDLIIKEKYPSEQNLMDFLKE